MVKLFNPVVVGAAVPVRERNFPIPLDRHASIVHNREVSSRKLVHAAEDRAWRWNVVEREVELEGLRIDRARAVWMREERLQFGGEEDASPRLGEVERLFTQPVACKEKRAPTTVPDREREHPVKAVHAACSELLVEVDEDLRVGPRLEDMLPCNKLASQRLEVVDLPVEDEDDGPVFACQRLPTAFDVDDGEPPKAEADSCAHCVRLLEEVALVVRPSMPQDAIHRMEYVERDGLAMRSEEHTSELQSHSFISYAV